MSPQAARPWAIMALIFILGAITGSLLTIGFAPRFAPAPHGPPPPQEMSNRWMRFLVYRLHLTDDQQAKIQPIVTDAETQIETAHHEDVTRISDILAKANANIKAWLNPDQQAELQKLESDRERMFRAHMHGGHGPGDFHHRGPGDHPPGPPPAAPVTPTTPPTS